MILWLKRLYRRFFPLPDPEWMWTPAQRAELKRQREEGNAPPLVINKISPLIRSEITIQKIDPHPYIDPERRA